MNRHIEQVIQELESTESGQADQQSVLSESDLSTIRNTPLWQLRQQLSSRQDTNAPD